MPVGPSIFRLAVSTRLTNGTGCTGSPWPTPTVADIEGGRKTRSGSRGDEMLLNGLMAAWSTVLASDVRKHSENPETVLRRMGKGQQVALNAFIALNEARGATPTGSPAPTEKRGAPNPVFACWLMGWPDELTSGALRAIQSFRKSRPKSSRRSSTAGSEPCV